METSAACGGDGIGTRHRRFNRAAGAMWRLVGFEAGVLEVTIRRGRKRKAPGVVHRHVLPASDVTLVERIPVTTPARTLIDLASVVTLETIEEALDDALRRGLVSIQRLRWRLRELARPGRPGVATMRRLLEARDPSSPVPDSVFQRRLLRVLRAGGLPEPIPQYEVRSAGRIVAVPDFAYPDAILAIEADSYRWHSGRSWWDRDRARRNRLTLLGWRVIHITWTELTRRPAGVVDAIRTALAAVR